MFPAFKQNLLFCWKEEIVLHARKLSLLPQNFFPSSFRTEFIKNCPWLRLIKEYLLDVKVQSHQSVLHRKAFKSSAVRPTTTSGGDTTVRINKQTLITPQIIPSLFSSAASVILTALAERTLNITDILKETRRETT